jgi:hypothetical protein
LCCTAAKNALEGKKTHFCALTETILYYGAAVPRAERRSRPDEMAAMLLRAARASRSLVLPRSIGASPTPLSSSSSAASTAETPSPAAAAPGTAADVDEAVIIGGEGDDLRSRVFGLRLAKRSATEALERWAGEGRAAPPPELRRIARDLSRARRYKHALEVCALPDPCSLMIALPSYLGARGTIWYRFNLSCMRYCSSTI